MHKQDSWDCSVRKRKQNVSKRTISMKQLIGKSDSAASTHPCGLEGPAYKQEYSEIQSQSMGTT